MRLMHQMCNHHAYLSVVVSIDLVVRVAIALCCIQNLSNCNWSKSRSEYSLKECTSTESASVRRRLDIEPDSTTAWRVLAALTIRLKSTPAAVIFWNNTERLS
jgi:hypothetical protein